MGITIRHYLQKQSSYCIDFRIRYFIGDIMGNVGSWVTTITDPPGIDPGPDAKPTFDPMYGFKNGRKERGKTSNILVMIATEEEMDAANLRPWERDFCAHKLIELQQCRNRVAPMQYRCSHEKHDLHT